MPSLQGTLVSKIARLGTQLLIALSLIGAAGSALAEAPLIYAYGSATRHLVSFRANAPGVLLTDIPITGMAASEHLGGIDFRPATGELYGIAYDTSGFARLVTINTLTGALTQVGASPFVMDNVASYGVSFSAVSDRIRVVSSTRNNWRINPDTGAVAAYDTSLAYPPDDPSAASATTVAHIANTNSFFGAKQTTVYGIDSAWNVLVRIGGLDGVPTSPNSGELITVGPLGLHPSTLLGGFDIEAGTGTAYASLSSVFVLSTSLSSLYTINLTTGSATLVGLIGTGALIDGLAIAPGLPTCLDLDGDGLALPLTDGLMLLRALLGLTGTAVTGGALPTPTPPRSTWSDIRAHMNANCGMRFGP